MPTLSRQHSSTTKSRLTIGQIREAIRTVRVTSTGKGWTVKKVADPKIWRFGTKQKALDRATKLAQEASYSIVIHGKSGQIIETLPAPGLDMPPPASRKARTGAFSALKG